MIEVGSNAGYVHNQRQGTGLATVLPTGTNSEEFSLFANRQQLAKQEALKARKAEADAARDALTKFNPERWFKHEEIIQPMMNDWVEKGAQMMAKGQNPWRDVTPEAQAWRKQQMEIQGIANTSKQMKELATKVQADINGSDADAYDLASVKAQKDYFDMDPRVVAKQGVLPPPLIKARPTADIQDFYGKLMGEVNGRRGEVPLNDNDRWDIVDETMRNPANQQKLMPSLMSALAIMPPNERADLHSRAQALGKSDIEVLQYDQVKLHEKPGKPFKLAEWIDDGVKELKVPYNEYQGTKAASKKVDEKEFEKNSMERATVMLTNPTALQEYSKLLPWPTGMNETDYKAIAIPDLAKRMRGMVATQNEYKILPSAAGDEDKKASGMQWLANIKDPNPDKNVEAAGYLLTAKDIFPGMQVVSAEVKPTQLGTKIEKQPDGTYKDVGTPINELVIKAEGKENLQKIKEKVMVDGVPEDQINIEQVGTEDILRIPITDRTENALLKMHDRAYDEMKAAYRGPLEQRKPISLKGILGGSQKGKQKKTQVQSNDKF